MGSNVEEQLKTTLHYDDKEKLRRKLALLQREYLRTAQRLQRAERLDAVRRHVESRITQQIHPHQNDPEAISKPRSNPSSLTLDTVNAQGASDSDISMRGQLSKLLLPSEEPSHATERGHSSSPSLRLRSRQSRLRREKRSAEACTITENSGQEGQEHEMMEKSETEREEEIVTSKKEDVERESEEPFPASGSGSPSLLLTHWKTNTLIETGNMPGNKIQVYNEQSEKEELTAEGNMESETTSLQMKCYSNDTEGGQQHCTLNGERTEMVEGEDAENRRGQTQTAVSVGNSIYIDMEENTTERVENEKRNDYTLEIKEEKIGVEGCGKSVGVLDSCTLVEGLLFPAEYYVRTTRRMTFSQSQPDMQAVILSQLSVGRHRRSRGRGLNRRKTGECSDQHTRITDISSQTTASVDPKTPLRVCSADSSPELMGNSQSSSDILNEISGSQTNKDTFSSAAVSTTHPARNGRRKRGRGRGRSRTPHSSLILDTRQIDDEQTPGDAHPVITRATSSPSLHGPDGPNPRLSNEEPVPVADDRPSVSTFSTGTQPSPGVNGALCSPASGRPTTIYPIFVKSSCGANTLTQMSRSPSSWRSLLLPSSPSAQTSLFPLPCLSTGSLVKNLVNFDIPQDFHLPDDQFASLKLHKLRRVAVESGVEHFASPSYNTRRSSRLSYPRYTMSDPGIPLALPLSLTPTVPKSQKPAAEKQSGEQSAGDLSLEHKHASLTPVEQASVRHNTETPGEPQDENLNAKSHNSSTESASGDGKSVSDCVTQFKEQDTVTLNTQRQCSISSNNTHSCINLCVSPQPHGILANMPAGKVNDYVVGQPIECKIRQPDTYCAGDACPVEDRGSTNHQKECKGVVEALFTDCALQETPVDPSNSCTAGQTCEDSEGPVKSPVELPHVNSAKKEPREAATTPPRDMLVDNSQHPSDHFLMSPSLAPAPCPSHLPPSAVLSSPTLPSLGHTPNPVSTALPLNSSPAAPALTLPPPHSPATQALSPPPLSPCPSIASLPHVQPLASPSVPNQAAVESQHSTCHGHGVEPATPATAPRIEPQGSGVQGVETTDETEEQLQIRHTLTLKSPAGGCLVDACCFPRPSGGLCLAAAGKWAVCLWTRTPAYDWSLKHTWTFYEPVINVFPVPDAAGLMIVTLGQLEITEVRMLSCSSLTHVLLCEGIVQAAVGASKSRVVTSSHSALGSTLQVFNVSDSSSMPRSQPLESPGVCVGALAPVEGLCDALIGTDEGGQVFVWNLKSGQLLRRLVLGDDWSHTCCLRGYSHCGVLFVLLQHQLFSSLEEEEKEAKAKAEDKEEKRKKTVLFSLVAFNPLSSKSVLATQLYPPKTWSGRLCEADVNSSGVVGLSQSGCVCVWELGHVPASRTVWAPRGEGWQLARWGGRDTLVTGHHNGDITLHHCSRT